MKAKLIEIEGTDPHQRIRWQCPGCKCTHEVPVPPHRQAWDWNGSLESPTLSPSVLVSYDPNPPPDRPAVSHLFVRFGLVQFCGDSKHELAGRTVPLPDLENTQPD